MKKATEPEGYCVSCPKCGRTNQRSIETVSHIHCARCHHDFTVYLRNKTMLIIIDGNEEEANRKAQWMWEYLKTHRDPEELQMGG